MPVHYQAPTPLQGRRDPEDGAAAKRVYEYINIDGSGNAPTAILGFACEAGVARNKGRIGAKQAPAAIRQALAGLAAPKTMPHIQNLGDVIVDGDDLEDGQVMLAQHIADALPQHKRVIVLGGGHETAYGSYLGLRAANPQAKIGIINLDAHLDLRKIGEAGASSGTPFNQIRQLDHDGFDYMCIGVAHESNSQALFDRATDWGVGIVFDKDINNDKNAANAKIHAMAQRVDIIYLTIDIDLMPHYQAPGVSAPAVRGVAFHIVEHLIDVINAACKTHHCQMPLADIVEVSPPHDRDGMTAKTAAFLALKLIADEPCPNV